MNSQYYQNQMSSFENNIREYNNKRNAANNELSIVQSQIKELEEFLSKAQKSKLDIDLISKEFTTISSYLENVIIKGKPFDEGEFEKKNNGLKNSSNYLKTLINNTSNQILKLKSKESTLKSNINAYTAQINVNQSQYEGAKYNFNVQSANEANAKAQEAQKQANTQNVTQTSYSFNRTCFQVGTKIAIENGYINIEELKEGDKVLTYNIQKKINEYKRVTKTIIHENTEDELYTLTFDNYILNVTASHRFFVDDDWKEAKYLKINDQLFNSNGDLIEIKNIKHKKYIDTYYNIEVEDNHNYYVSEKEILVHNAKKIE